MPTNEQESPYAGCIGLAEILLVFVAMHGKEWLLPMLAHMDKDRLSLHEAAAELKRGGAYDLAAIVLDAVRMATRAEPAWRTARKRRDREHRKRMLAAFQKMKAMAG
jgi:hypothetical protein